jgi:hypothetical protein
MGDETLHARWLVENRVRLVTVKNDLKTSAVRASDLETAAILDEMTERVHFVIDLRELRSFPKLDSLLSVQCLRHQHMGWLLTVGATRSSLHRFFLNAVGQATRVRYQDFHDLEEAIVFLQENEPSLKGAMRV